MKKQNLAFGGTADWYGDGIIFAPLPKQSCTSRTVRLNRECIGVYLFKHMCAR